MLAIMRLVSIICERLKSLGLGYVAGIWVLALWAGLGAPTVGISWQYGLPLAQDTPPNNQDQTKSQTQEEAQNSAGQPIPEGEQSQVEAGSEPPQPSAAERGDEMLAGIQAALGNVSSPDLGLLGQAFNTTLRKQDEASSESSAVELIDLGDLDGDGVSEVALKLLVTETSQEAAEGQASPSISRALYLLSWDGAHWKASALAAPAEDIQFQVVRLGKSAGRCIAVVNIIGEEAAPYPAIFQMREHEAALLWDSQVEDNSL